MTESKQLERISVLTMIIKILPLVISVSPTLFIFNTILFILGGISTSVSVFYMQLLFDRITDLAVNIGTMKNVVLALLIFFLIKVIKHIITGINNFIGESYDPRVVGKLTYVLNQKVANLDPVSFEDPKVLDDINKSYVGIRFAKNFINTIIDVITFYIPYFISMGFYLFSLKPLLLLILVFVFVPIFFVQLIRAKIYAKLEDDSALFRRKMKYYENCLTGREYLKETRSLGACPYFIKIFEEALVQMNTLGLKASVKANLVELSMRVITLSGYLGVIWTLFNALIKQDITVGAFAAVFAAVDGMFSTMEEVICDRLGYYAQNFGKVQNYLKSLNLPERKGNYMMSNASIHKDVILENVSFRYPSMSKNAVENINLRINAGETVAIVGENGSGKSTLVRLITGIYLPQSGRVLHDNVPTSEFSLDSLFMGISAVFQKFQKYQLSLEHNITISDMDNKLRFEANVNNATLNAGIELDVEVFPYGYNTMLSREFDGVDLSGGQWQKIAIARGLYRNHQLIALDEPTAAIDPIEEKNTYEHFIKIVKNKTAVIVTHRLGSAKFADRIIVMKDGSVIEVGTHDELILNCHIYRHMWNSQSQHYSND